MSRPDGKLTAAGEAPLELTELLAALEAEGAERREWREAIACYLSGSTGWRDASALLGGAFAGEGAHQRLNGKKEP